METTLHLEIESSMIFLYILEFKEHVFKAAALSLTKVQGLSFTPDHRNKRIFFHCTRLPQLHQINKYPLCAYHWITRHQGASPT